MLTFYDAPWIDYLEINEENGERYLREDTPQDIREKYEKHCEEQNKYTKNNELRPK